MIKDNLTDRELDVLLQSIKQPELPIGFAERLQAKFDVQPVSNVVAFPLKPRTTVQPSKRTWLSAVPLAASLAIGVYMGAMAELPDMLSGLEDTVASLSGSPDLGIGIEDMESFLDGEQS